MSRLIDADDLRREIDKHWPFTKEEQCKHGIADMAKSELLYVLNQMPTIEERKKGKWIPVTKIYKVTEEQFPKMHIEWVDATEPDEIDGVRCSECSTVYDFIEARNWCSECGARMER